MSSLAQVELHEAGHTWPQTKNWKDRLATLIPVDQAACGSCWAVTAAMVLEAHANISGNNRSFSAQHLVNCVPNVDDCGGTGGCDGATVELAYTFVQSTGLNSRWPTIAQVSYYGHDDTCVSNHMYDQVHGLIGWNTLPKNEYGPLMNALINQGPVAVSVAASPWQSYQSGIFNNCSKGVVVDHAVTLVGFGVGTSGAEADVGYWLIQNSWSEMWGEQGYLRLHRLLGTGSDSEQSYCGTDDTPLDGTGCAKGAHAVVAGEGEWVCGTCGILFDSVVPNFSPAPAPF